MPKAEKHTWTFARRFRARAFGWRSQPAITRVKEAVSEIKKVTRKDPLLGAEGAVRFLEKVSPALERVDSSSGSIGTAVNNAIAALVPIIAAAPADAKTRVKWLERLWEAHQNDEIPYLESLADDWGALCASPLLASKWADELAPVVELAWSPDPELRGFFGGTTACLSCLLVAGRHEELLSLLEKAPYLAWHNRRYGVLALAALGRVDEALEYAEASIGRNDSEAWMALTCEQVLLKAGREEEAYERFAIEANQGTSHLATYRAIVKRYPQKGRGEVLADLIRSTPGDEGKWFATAKELKMYELAAQLAHHSACEPKTLNRAARAHLTTRPEFALYVALASLKWLAQGWGYEVTGYDVIEAYDHALAAASALEREEAVHEQIRKLVAGDHSPGMFVRQVLGRRLDGR